MSRAWLRSSKSDQRKKLFRFCGETLHAFIFASPLSGWRVWNVRRGCVVSQSRLMLSDVADLGLSPLPLTATWPISASNAPSLQRHMLDSSRKSGLSFTGRDAAICIYTFTPSLMRRYPLTQLGRPLAHANECLSPHPLAPERSLSTVTNRIIDFSADRRISCWDVPHLSCLMGTERTKWSFLSSCPVKGHASLSQTAGGGTTLSFIKHLPV